LNRLEPKQMLLLWELWINKKITEFDASTTTQATFHSGLHKPMGEQQMCAAI